MPGGGKVSRHKGSQSNVHNYLNCANVTADSIKYKGIE